MRCSKLLTAAFLVGGLALTNASAQAQDRNWTARDRHQDRQGTRYAERDRASQFRNDSRHNEKEFRQQNRGRNDNRRDHQDRRHEYRDDRRR